MFELKSLHADAVSGALEKAERYRLLNEPDDAESICRDVLHIDKNNETALVTMVLALTDQFGQGLNVSIEHAQQVLPRLGSDYDRVYYEGIILERWGRAQLLAAVPGYVVYDWYRRAIDCYERAERIRPQSNDDAILRWNACVRVLKRHEHVRPRAEDHSVELNFNDDVMML